MNFVARASRVSPTALALVLTACGGSGGSPSASSPIAVVPAPTPTSTPTPTPAAAIAAPPLSVAFIGGSITLGIFEPSSNSWGVGTLASLRQSYTVTAHDYSYPGSGSQFAAYRMAAELGTTKPDLAFIEFAVNDGGWARSDVRAHTDAIIDQLRTRNAAVRIVYVAMTSGADETDRWAGREPDRVQWLRELAAEEGIAFVDAGAALWQRVLAGRQDITAYLPDTLHPNAAGAQIYTAAVTDFLAKNLATWPLPNRSSGVLVAQSHLSDAHIVAGSAASGCHVRSLDTMYLHDSLVCLPGETFTYRFTGTTLGFLQGVQIDSGYLTCSMDGDPEIPLGFRLTMAQAGKLFMYPTYRYRGLTAGPHTLECKARAEPGSPSSDENAVIIGGFEVSSYVTS